MAPAALNIVASARVSGSDQPPPVPRFIVSDFAPLVYAAVQRCLGGPVPGRAPDLPDLPGDRTGIVLSSREFDTVTLELSVRQASRGRISPILFYQVLPTAVLGQIALDFQLSGPVSCVAATGDTRDEALEVAWLTLADDSADWMIAVTAELADNPADSFATADLVGRPVPGGVPGTGAP